MRALPFVLVTLVACSSSSGSEGGSDGSANCAEAEAEWQQALDDAKACNPLVAQNECVVTTESAPHCGCPTFVGNGNQTAIATLETLKNQLPAACVAGPCANDCATPTSGVCQVTDAGSAVGRCQNVY